MKVESTFPKRAASHLRRRPRRLPRCHRHSPVRRRPTGRVMRVNQPSDQPELSQKSQRVGAPSEISPQHLPKEDRSSGQLKPAGNFDKFSGFGKGETETDWSLSSLARPLAPPRSVASFSPSLPPLCGNLSIYLPYLGPGPALPHSVHALQPEYIFFIMNFEESSTSLCGKGGRDTFYSLLLKYNYSKSLHFLL